MSVELVISNFAQVQPSRWDIRGLPPSLTITAAAAFLTIAYCNPGLPRGPQEFVCLKPTIMADIWHASLEMTVRNLPRELRYELETLADRNHCVGVLTSQKAPQP